MNTYIVVGDTLSTTPEAQLKKRHDDLHFVFGGHDYAMDPRD